MSDQEDGNRKVAQEQRSQQEAARRQQEAQQAQQAREAQQYAQQQRAQEQAGRQQEQQQRQQEQSQRSKEQQDKRTDANKKQDDKHDDHQDDTKSRQEQTSTAGEHQRSSSAADSLNGPAKHPVTERSSTEEHRSDDKAGIAQTGTPTEQPHAQRDESDQRNASASATTTQGRAGAATDAAASQAPPADGQHNDAHAVTGGTGETMPPGTGEVINRTSATDGRAGGAHADGGQHDDPTNGAHNDNANATFAQSLNPDHGDSDETLRRILDFTGEGDGEPDAVEHEHPPAIGHGAVQPVTTPADADRHDDHTNSNANSSSNPAGSGHKYGPPEDIHLYPPGTNASHDPAEQPTRTEGAREDAPVDRQRSLPHTSLDGSPANGPLSAGDPTRVQPAPTTPPASPSIPDHGAAQSLAGRHSTGRDAVIAAAMAGFDGDDPAEEQTTPEVRAFERVVHDAGPGARRPTLALPTDDPSPTGVILEASRHVSTIDQVHERWGVTSKADLAAAARDADDHLNTSLSADERTRYESEAGEIRQEALSRALPYVPGPQLHQISDALHATLTELQSYEEVSGATQTLRSLAAVDHEIERRDALPRETHAPRPSLISTWSDSANRHIYGDRTDDGAEIGRGITRAVVNTLNIPALVADGIVLGYHSVHDPQTYDPAQHMTASSYTVIQTDNAGDDEALIRAGIDQAGSIAASLVPVASEGMATVALIEALRSGDRGRIGEAGAGLVLTVAPRIVSRLRSEPGVSEPPRQLPGATVESPPRLPAGEGSSRSGGAGTGSGGPPLGIGPEPHDTLVDHPAAGPTSTPAGAPPVSAPVDAQGTGGVPDVEGLDTAAAPPTPESAALTPQQVQRIAAQAAHGDPVVTARVERAIEDLRGDPTVSFDSARNISAMAHHIAEAARTRNITHVLSETEFSHARQQWRQRDMNEPGQTTVHLREFRQAYEYHLAGGEGEPPDGFRTDDNVTHILDDPTTRRGPGPAAEPVDPHATTGLHNTPPHPPAQTPGPPPTTAPSTHTTGPEPHDTLVDHPAAGPTSTPAGAPPVSAPVDAQGTGGVPDVEGLDTAAAPPTPESAALTPQQVQRIAAQAAHGDPVVTARVERAIEDLRGDPTVSFDSARNISAMAHHIAEAARTRNITHVLSETEFSHARQQWRQRDMNEPGQTTVHLREFRQAYEYHLAGGEGEPPDGFRTDDNVTHILDDPTTRRGPGPAAEPVDPHATTGLHNTPPHPPAQTPGPPPTTAPSTHTTGPEPHDTLVDAPVPGGPRGGPGEPTPRDTIVTGSHATPDQIRQFAEAAANGDAHIAGRVERALHDMQGNRTIHFDSIDDVHRAAEYLAHQAGSREITQVFPEATARALNEAWHHGATSFDHYGNVHFAILEAEHSFQWHLAGGEGTAPDAFRTADGITHVRNADLPTPPGITATPQTYGDAPATRVPVAQVGPSAAPVDPPPLAQLDAGAANALGQTPARAAPAGVVRPDPAQAPRPGPAAGAGHGPAAPRQWPAGKRDRMVAMSAVTPEQGAGAEPPAGFIARHDALGAGTVARPVNPSPPQGEPPNPPGPPTPAGAQPERPVAAGDAARTERRLPAFFDDGEVLPRDQWGLNRNPPAQRVSLNEVTSPNIGMMLQVWARLKEIDPGLADDYLRGLGIEPDERR